MPELLSHCLRGLEGHLAGRSVRIVRQIDPTTPPILVDREALKRIVDSLLLEAGDSTPQGSRVRVCLKHNASAVMLSIKDGGPGMTQERLDALLGGTGARVREGASLSPAECGKSILGLGGNFFANSKPGKGSTYYITFPPPEPRDEPDEPAASRGVG